MPTNPATPTPAPLIPGTPTPLIPVSPGNSEILKIKDNPYIGPVAGVLPILDFTILSSTKSVSISKALPLNLKLTPVEKRKRDTISMRLPNGETVVLKRVTSSRNGTFSIPPIQFKESGKYTITVKTENRLKNIKLKITD
jgi:hypothetical protein